MADAAGQPPAKKERASRRRRLLAWGSGGLAVLLAATGLTGYLAFRHLDANIRQADVRPMLGHQPPDLRPQAQNIVVIGSDTRQGQGSLSDPNLVTDQSDTLMVIHVPASRKWAEVMSVPRDSWVPIPSCVMGDGQLSSPHQFKVNEAFAIGNLYGNHTATGAACTIKTLEQDTGIYVDHFIVVDFNGFRDMVAALGGVSECNMSPISDPQAGLFLSAGYHLLTPQQALVYVRARYGLGDGSDLGRITRQQVFLSSLITRARGRLLDPLGVYRFLDAATRSVTIDSQLGGITGLYDLERSLHGIPARDIIFFTVPNFPRGRLVPSDTANVLWSQPQANAIFRSMRDDLPASPALLNGQAPKAGKGLAAGSMPQITPSPAPTLTHGRTANQSICVS